MRTQCAARVRCGDVRKDCGVLSASAARTNENMCSIKSAFRTRRTRSDAAPRAVAGCQQRAVVTRSPDAAFVRTLLERAGRSRLHVPRTALRSRARRSSVQCGDACALRLFQRVPANDGLQCRDGSADDVSRETSRLVCCACGGTRHFCRLHVSRETILHAKHARRLRPLA